MNRRALLVIVALLLFSLAFYGGNKLMTRKEFRDKFLREIQGLDLKGFPAYILLGLASYESGDGAGSLAVHGNNIFSLQVPTKTKWTGPKILQASTGNYFRAYGSYRAAVEDFLNMMTIVLPTRYGAAVAAARANNPQKFAESLQVAGYGDPGKQTYASELVSRIKALA